MADNDPSKLLRLDPASHLWDRFFNVAPLVLIGSRESDGGFNLAPKHMAGPLGSGGYFGFVCTPRHGTYHNIRDDGFFTVSYPRPAQVLQTSLAASPRTEEGAKPLLASLATFPMPDGRGVFLAGGYAFLGCELYKVYDDFGENSLIAGRVVTALVHPDSLRSHDRDDHDLIHQAPLLAYLDPGRFASVAESLSFPYHAEMRE